MSEVVIVTGPGSIGQAIARTIVLDDFTPGEPAHDEARGYWLNHEALRAVELLLTPALSTLVGRRIR